MAITNHERVGKAMELLKDGLQPYVERELKAKHAQRWFDELKTSLPPQQLSLAGTEAAPKMDAALVLKVIWDQWQAVFRNTLGQAERSLVSELRDARNKWAHQEPFSSDDTYRTLDSTERLLSAVSAPQSDEIGKLKQELLRVRFDEQVRSEKRKSAGTAIESAVTGSLKPWREVITPHHDVASGRYQQAEFAADLWQVHLGEGGSEYRDPAEFYRRTYLTESLKRLLSGAIQRLSGQGADPVVQLQTNFGGGKTHSMLALYHLFSGVAPRELSGIEPVLQEAGITKLPKAKRVVLVGNKISPGNPVVKPDGTVMRTLWGELAYQLGGKKAYKRIQLDDERATNPGDRLRELFNEYAPCLILIDEWVAYARQLHDQGDLPAGNFETQFSFAQALTESAKAAKDCLLVISLPASDTGTSPHAQADDTEVGGQRGREALERLRNVIGRVESSWRPASAEEGFEIVRRRLFEPLVEKEQFVARDGVAQAFFDQYRTQQAEFPPDCREADYEKRLRAAYPIHPEIFDRLYTDWSTLVKFQRTRGVLRLMAAVIHSLWEKGDRNPLILPCNISIDDPRVQFELTRYLSDNWVPAIEKDVDGPNALPLRLDNEIPNLGKLSACRRVARTIYMGSAPTTTAAHRGLEDRRVKLGCVMPGESPAVFGDALRRLASSATFLYQDGSRYWYSTQPTVTKIAEDRAEQLKRESDKVVQEVDRRLRLELKKTGDFSRVHALPQSGADVPDDTDARLVVLDIEHPHSREASSAAQAFAQTILESRGSAPRLYRNTLVFLAVDKTRLQDLDEAARRFLAWESIVEDEESLELSAGQKRQAATQKAAADSKLDAQIPEAYQWLLAPVQSDPKAQPGWQATRLNGQDALAVRASKKLKNDELLLTVFAATRLRLEMDAVPLWRGDHVPVRTLMDDFPRYLYLPRLTGPNLLAEAMREGVGLLLWEQEAFAYADSYDEAAGRYRGLRAGERVPIAQGDPGLLVRPEVARRQMDKERAETQTTKPIVNGEDKTQPPVGLGTGQGADLLPTKPPQPVQPKRYYASVTLDPKRMGRDAGQIAEEITTHLMGLPGASITVTLELHADVPGGIPDNIVRIVRENGKALKFGTQEFETE
jgi:predicted AAA+ superfamily ATPase